MKNIFILIGVALIGLTSCSEDNPDDLITDPVEQISPEDVVIGDPTTAKCYIESMTKISSAGYGEAFEFNYDDDSNLERVTEKELMEDGTVDDEDVEAFEYDTQGRIIKKYYSEDKDDSFYSEYVYEEDRIIRFTFESGYDGTMYEWRHDYMINDKNQIIEGIGYSKKDGEWIEGYYKSIFYWTNDNLTTVEQYRKNSEGIFEVKSMHEFTYDEQFNPFKSMPVVFNNWDYDLFTASNNNIVEVVYTNTGENSDVRETDTYNYTYNENGYPVSAEVTFEEVVTENGQVESNVNTSTLEFTYICE